MDAYRNRPDVCGVFMAGIVISITIKIYYRVMVIKYHEKDTHIELFKELESNR